MTIIFKGKLIAPKPQDYLAKIIEPVLCTLPGISSSQAAAQLLLGTAIKESGNFKYRKQIGGPALSFFQIEPESHQDIWDSYLKFRPQLKARIESIMTKPDADKLHELENNESYAAVMARIKYQRCPEKIPDTNDIAEMARYWKKYYNTPLGKGTVKGYLDMWNKSVGQKTLVYKKACA